MSHQNGILRLIHTTAQIHKAAIAKRVKRTVQMRLVLNLAIVINNKRRLKKNFPTIQNYTPTVAKIKPILARFSLAQATRQLFNKILAFFILGGLMTACRWALIKTPALVLKITQSRRKNFLNLSSISTKF